MTVIGQILFSVMALDHEEKKNIREKTRPDHLKFISENSDKVILAGPFVDDQGDSIGSLYMISVPSEDEAWKFINSDPYSDANLFKDIQIRRWRFVIDNVHVRG